MHRILAALGVTGLALLGASATAVASPPESSGGDGKITICHATGSDTNPYVSVTMSLNALKAHLGHQHNEDIIPANSMLPAGQNLHKVDWWNAGCAKPGGTPHEGNDKKITICHATGSASNPYVVITIALQGLNGHAGDHHQHTEDIIPPNHGKVIPSGQNWTDDGKATYNNGCVPTVVPPAVVPPAVVPPAGAVVPAPAPAPAGAVVGGGAVTAVNEGFNVQTAVSEPDPGMAPWLGGAAVLLLAGGAIAARKTLAAGGSRHGEARS
jgi:hypothetical protein